MRRRCTFTAPEGATGGLLALEKRTTETGTVTVHVDNVELIPVKTVPDQDKKERPHAHETE
ncbi:MAG: hypothetical protein ABIP48_03905 [Planctomycetota bacterium]